MSVIIRLKNLPMSAGAADVRSFFNGLKIPEGAVHIIGGDEGEVFVGFASDDDARIAMTRDRYMIHGAEIRLLLSSKSEQNSVIAARKNSLYGSPAQPEEFAPPVSSQPPKPTWQPQPTGNPYAAKSGYEASYPPQNSNYQNNQNNFNGRPEISQNALASPKKDNFGGDYGSSGFKPNFQQPPPALNRFASRPPVEPPRPAMNQPPPVAKRFSPERNFGYNKAGGNNNEIARGNQNGARAQGGDSWRDSSYSQPPKNNFNNDGFNKSNYPPEPAFNGPNKFNTLPPPLPANTRAPPDPAPYQPPARKTLMPTPTPAAPFQNGPPPPFAGASQGAARGPAPFQNGPPPAPFAPPTPAFNKPPPAVAKPVIPAPMATAPVPTEKFYIELTRLPNELLRPASLEAFIRPTVPLTLSSVKTVFGPGGIHMHTIIRLDSIADYATMMRRNGEQGIKIQQSDRKSFDTAEDGAPVPALPLKQTEPPVDEQKRRSRWENTGGSPQRSPPIRRREERSRSRSPPRRRRRSRSPPRRRREEHTDPTRWCVQVTNVPFRMKEEELLEWFAEKVKPAKLSRTYYSDGNASDRWIAEFSSESLMRRSFSIRTLCTGRTLKLTYIDNKSADDILRIEDVYGQEKKQINEEARAMQEEAEKSNPPSFFNAPPPSFNQRGPPIFPPPNNNFNGPPPTRGGFMPRGNGFPRGGGGMGRGAAPGAPFHQGAPPNQFNNGNEQGGFRGGFRGGRGARGGAFQGFRGNEEQSHPTRNEFMELVQSLGSRGTVLSCNGFPKDVTMEDVVDFFDGYEPDRNSIRIRRGDDGIMTGECMLACLSTENARRASQDLDGQQLRNSQISVRLV